MQGGKLVITKAQMEAKQGKKLDSVRYIRIRFQNVKGNAASNADFATKQAEGIKIRVCGTTNVYADYEDNSGLYSEAAFIRPEQLQFYGYTANTSLEQIFKPAKSPAQSAKPYRTTMYVEKPHPYGFLQAIFEDTKLKDASGAPLNPNYGSRTAEGQYELLLFVIGE